MKAALAVTLVFAITATLSASQDPATDVATRAKGAGRVVVAKVVSVQSHFDVNQWGDQLIVSDAEMQVEETLKGAHAAALTVTLEGGSIGDLTLDVSDMPSMKKGERAVLFLNQTPAGGHVPWGRGNGVLKLDSSDHVDGSNVTLDDVKRMVKDAR
jgi:hypothetical protein